MTAFVLSFAEVVLELDKSAGATRVWLHRHNIRASGGLAKKGVPRGTPRAVYDGTELLTHKRGDVPDCAACRGASTAAQHVTSSASGPTVSTAPQGQPPVGR